MSSDHPPDPPSTPKTPAPEASSSYSPYRPRLNGLTRREMLEKKRRSPRKQANQSPRGLTSADGEPPHTPMLAEVDLANKTPISLVQRRAQMFGGSSSEKKRYDHKASSPGGDAVSDDERKSHISGGGTTVTTAASSTSQPTGYSPLLDDRSDVSHQKRERKHESCDSQLDSFVTESPTQPLHLQASKSAKQSIEKADDSSAPIRYYRIVYKGVIPLLSSPDPYSSKSGAYLSYGEIIATRYEFDVDEDEISRQDSPASPSSKHQGSETGHSASLPPFSPPRSLSSQNSGSVSSLDTLRTSSTAPTNVPSVSTKKNSTKTRHVIRVDEMVTGGYAVGANIDHERIKPNAMQTPKRSNIQPSSPSNETVSPLDGTETTLSTQQYGFLFTHKKNVVIAEPIPDPPTFQRGQFLYKITSASPLPILFGPCVDAPRTRAMVLPGTIHDVSLRFTPDKDGVMLLRLSHRHGWIVDRRISHVGGKNKLRSVALAKEVSGEIGTSCDASTSSLSNTSLTSLDTSSIAAPVSISRRRHRPPRRQRERKNEATSPPRPKGAATPETMDTMRSRKSESSLNANKTPKQENVASPISNVSMLSDESSVDRSSYQGLSSEVRSHHSIGRQPVPLTPSLFLMKVNAPRGLKILDAPHFQVSSLIHGQQGTSKAPASSPQSRLDIAPKPTNSIFQTMGGSHTTTPRSRGFGNPAVFDGKTRTLPRGAMFEASSRMEATGSTYSQGAGLIKLSDGSGWAIVPRQSELDNQYRHYHGGVTSIREGEATRAFEEVGNAVLDETDTQQTPNVAASSSVWLRIVTRNGVLVSCPPPKPSAITDEDTSPTSSTAGCSSIVSGGGSNYGVLTSQDSDVASSVGSAFLDAVFRTPKKRETERETEATKKGPDQKPPPANVIACGTCVEVDNWDTRPGVYQDFVRLVEGQGWIPRQLGGRPCTIPVERPDVRLGSFWFRVQPTDGIKVRVGPSRRAPSIKSDDGTHFRFECGEFLRACEVVTMFDTSAGTQTFAKLYRNRHIQFLKGIQGLQRHRLLASMTTQAEWVQVHSQDQLYLEECASAPHIQRHRQGWRYNAVADSGIQVRKGPSFCAENCDSVLLGGESVLINERVTAPGERITWLRLRDSQGWVHDVGLNGEVMMIAHSLHDRSPTRVVKRPVKPGQRPHRHDEAAYNTIIARLFHGDADESGGHQGLHRTYNV